MLAQTSETAQIYGSHPLRKYAYLYEDMRMKKWTNVL